MASSSRKAFWLLKSFNHVHSAIILIENYSHAADECYANLIDILEQLCLIVYYFYENLVFVARTKLVSFTEENLDWWGDWSWFFEDFTCFLAAALRTWIHSRNLMIAESEHMCILDVDSTNGSIARTAASTIDSPAAAGQSRRDKIEVNNGVDKARQSTTRDLEARLVCLRKKHSDSLLTLAIVSTLCTNIC